MEPGRQLYKEYVRKMSIEKTDPAELWQRFNELATMNAIEREEVYRSDGMLFLPSLIASFMKNGVVPELDNAAEFADFIVELRENYRLWNQRLMSLMIAFRADTQASDTDLLRDFVATCPWTELIEAAHDFVDSTS
jgi:hypothetical protein